LWAHGTAKEELTPEQVDQRMEASHGWGIHRRRPGADSDRDRVAGQL